MGWEEECGERSIYIRNDANGGADSRGSRLGKAGAGSKLTAGKYGSRRMSWHLAQILDYFGAVGLSQTADPANHIPQQINSVGKFQWARVIIIGR